MIRDLCPQEYDQRLKRVHDQMLLSALLALYTVKWFFDDLPDLIQESSQMTQVEARWIIVLALCFVSSLFCSLLLWSIALPRLTSKSTGWTKLLLALVLVSPGLLLLILRFGISQLTDAGYGLAIGRALWDSAWGGVSLGMTVLAFAAYRKERSLFNQWKANLTKPGEVPKSS